MNPPCRAAMIASAIIAAAVVLSSAAIRAADPSPSASAGSTAASMDPVVIEIGCSTFAAAPHQTQEVRVPLGASLVLRICSNASTGYTWGDPRIGDEALLRLSSTGSLPAPSPMPGAAGIQTYEFESIAGGTTTVDLSYDQPWENGDKGAWTLHLDVILSAADSLSIDCDAFVAQPQQTATVSLRKDADLLVTVCSNASTGYTWFVASPTDPSVIAVTGSSAASPAGSQIGAPGTQTFRFHATGSGSTVVTLTYDQPWNGGEKGAWTLELDVTVS